MDHQLLCQLIIHLVPLVEVDKGKIGVGVGHLDVECRASVEKGTFWRGLSIAGRKVERSPLREAGMGPFQSLGWAPPC